MWLIIIGLAVVAVALFFVLNKDSMTNDKTKQNHNITKGDNSIEHPELGRIELPDSSPPSVFSSDPETQKNNNDNESNTVSDENLPSEESTELPDDILETAIEEVQKNTDLDVESLVESGFTEEGAKSISSGDPENVISIQDMPQELQASILQDFERSKKNGYDDVEDKDADEITGIFNYIVGTAYPIPKLTFQPSNVPVIIPSNFSYLGYTYPNAFVSQSADGLYDSVRRVFQSNDSSYSMILEETSLQAGSANLIKEFVNSNVYGYPSIYAIKKSPSGKTYAMLNWSSENYAYSLYQVGSLDNAQNILISLGNSITEANLGSSKQDENLPSNTEAPSQE